MNQKSSGRPPDHRILKKEIFGYAGICLAVLVFLGAGGVLTRTFPVKALAGALCYLVVGGLGMPAGIFWFRPAAEQSEFFKTFNLLYHPGVWILAAASFLEESGFVTTQLIGNLHLVYIAGWTFLMAGVIVLVIILRDVRT